MAYKAPKAIAGHPGVEECSHGPSNGCDIEDKHDVLLKDGWFFDGLDDDQRQDARFGTVADFKRTPPVYRG